MGGGEGEDVMSQLMGAQSVGGEEEDDEEENEGSLLMDLAFLEEDRL